jgi:hypothetical protein
MRLSTLELFGVGALSGVKLAFGDGTQPASGSAGPSPRALTVLFGADGVGKTAVLTAIASTRPGHPLPLLPRRSRGSDEAPTEVPFATTEWMLGDDDPDRPHPLRVSSPNAHLGEHDGEAALRRREQALFDRRAQEHGGYAFVAFSGARWFSRTPVVVASPERTVLRYDVRAAASFDDASRADLTRETKQVLAVAAIGSALEREGGAGVGDLSRFDIALREVAALVLAPFRAEYDGVEVRSLEPLFSLEGRDAMFEELPRGARHLLAIVTLSMRVLYAAYGGSPRAIREREGLVLIDDLESQQDAAVLRHLPSLLKAVLPRVQWIVATSASAVTLGCERDEVVALRREPAHDGRVLVHEGAFAVLH